MYLDGKSYQEIAQSLNRTPKSIDNALQRVKKKMEKFADLRQNKQKAVKIKFAACPIKFTELCKPTADKWICIHFFMWIGQPYYIGYQQSYQIYPQAEQNNL